MMASDWGRGLRAAGDRGPSPRSTGQAGTAAAMAAANCTTLVLLDREDVDDRHTDDQECGP